MLSTQIECGVSRSPLGLWIINLQINQFPWYVFCVTCAQLYSVRCTCDAHSCIFCVACGDWRRGDDDDDTENKNDSSSCQLIYAFIFLYKCLCRWSFAAGKKLAGPETADQALIVDIVRCWEQKRWSKRKAMDYSSTWVVYNLFVLSNWYVINGYGDERLSKWNKLSTDSELLREYLWNQFETDSSGWLFWLQILPHCENCTNPRCSSLHYANTHAIDDYYVLLLLFTSHNNSNTHHQFENSFNLWLALAPHTRTHTHAQRTIHGLLATDLEYTGILASSALVYVGFLDYFFPLSNDFHYLFQHRKS